VPAGAGQVIKAFLLCDSGRPCPLLPLPPRLRALCPRLGRGLHCETTFNQSWQWSTWQPAVPVPRGRTPHTPVSVLQVPSLGGLLGPQQLDPAS